MEDLYEHFGESKDDWGLVAEVDSKISLYKEYRGLGIGTAMMKEIFTLLKPHGYSRVSLSVQKANYAAKMYLKIGFEIVRENEEEFVMICHL